MTKTLFQVVKKNKKERNEIKFKWMIRRTTNPLPLSKSFKYSRVIASFIFHKDSLVNVRWTPNEVAFFCLLFFRLNVWFWFVPAIITFLGHFSKSPPRGPWRGEPMRITTIIYCSSWINQNREWMWPTRTRGERRGIPAKSRTPSHYQQSEECILVRP